MVYGIYYKGNLIYHTDNTKDFKTKFNELTGTEYKHSYSVMKSQNEYWTLKDYTYRTNRFKNELPDTIPYKPMERGNKYHRRTYNKYIYAFDIETSTYDLGDRNLSMVYLAGAKSILCNPKDITVDNYNNYTTEFIKMRSYEDIDNWLYHLDELSVNKGFITVIYIHNLAYEFSFFQNLKFIREYFSNDNLLSIDMRQPFKLTCHNIEFRCSYKLTGLSLKVIGHNLGIEKLIDTKETYDTQYTPLSNIPDNEWIYNERDVDITLLAVIYQLKNSGAFQTINDIDKLLTVTGLTRAENKILSTKQVQRNYATFCQAQSNIFNNDMPNNKKVYQFLEDSFLGGYVRANRFELFKPFKNVGSIDIASSYPTQMLNRKYPYNWINQTDNMLEQLMYMITQNQEHINSYGDCIEDWYFQTKTNVVPYYFIADIELIDVKVKKFNNHNELPFMSLHKIIVNKIPHTDKTFVVDNGRLLSSRYVRLTITNIDFIIISLFYDFKIKDCKSLLWTTEIQKLNKFVINSINFYAEQKVMFKQLLKDCKNNKKIKKDNFYSNRLQKYITNEKEIDIFETSKHDEQIKFLEQQLGLSKSRLNAQYGINVQKVAPEEITFNIDTNEWYHKEMLFKQPRSLLRNYSDGVFIVAYSRLHLIIMTYMLYKYTDTTILYWDTDSIKYYNDNENVLQTVNYFNEKLEKYWCVSKRYNLGVFDYEGTYDWFVTGGAKCYMTSTDNKISLTVSGVPSQANEEYNRLYKLEDYNFETFCYKYFHPNTVITSSISNKLSMGYYTNDDNKFDCEVIDEQGNKFHFKGYSGCILCDSDFTIYGIRSRLDMLKYIIMTRTTGYKPNRDITIIGKQNKIDNKLKTDLVVDGGIL